MKRIFAFLLLLFIPTFVWADEELDKLLDSFNDITRINYSASILKRNIDIKTARAYCNKIFNVAKSKNLPELKRFLKDGNQCIVIDSSICSTGSEDDVYDIVVYAARYFYNWIKYQKNICEEQIIQYSDCRQDWKKAIALKQAQIKWEDTKKTDIQCSNTEDYCIVNHPCTGIEDMFSENCYMCVAMYKLEVNDKCQLTNVNYSLKSSWTTNPKTLNDFDKDCKPLWE